MKLSLRFLRILSLSMCVMTLHMIHCMDGDDQWRDAPRYSNIIQIMNAVPVDTHDVMPQADAVPVHIFDSTISREHVLRDYVPTRSPEAISVAIPEADNQGESCNQRMHRLMRDCSSECLEPSCRMAVGSLCLPFVACAFAIRECRQNCNGPCEINNSCCAVSEPVYAADGLCCPPYVTVQCGPCTCCLLHSSTPMECCMNNMALCCLPCGLCYVACCSR